MYSGVYLFLIGMTAYAYKLDVSHVNTADTTNAADATTDCTSDVDCSHGYCNDNNVCQCFHGWKGQMCDQPVFSFSNLAKAFKHHSVSSTHSKAMGLFPVLLKKQDSLKPSKSSFKINPSDIRTDVTKETKVSIQNKLTSDHPIDMNTDTDGDSESNVCSHRYISPPLQKRICSAGFICEFGTCAQEHHGSFISVECSCDSGASGIFCENKCCLDCGQHGICELFSNGTQYCDCHSGFTGETCQFSEHSAETITNTNSGNEIHVTHIVPDNNLLDKEINYIKHNDVTVFPTHVTCIAIAITCGVIVTVSTVLLWRYYNTILMGFFSYLKKYDESIKPKQKKVEASRKIIGIFNLDTIEKLTKNEIKLISEVPNSLYRRQSSVSMNASSRTEKP